MGGVVVVNSGQGLGPGQAADEQLVYAGLSRHDHHGVGVPRPEHHGRHGNGVAAGGAGGVDRHAGPLDAVGNGELGRGQIAQDLCQELGADLFSQIGGLLGPADLRQTVQSSAHHDPRPEGVHLHAAVPEGLLRRGVGVVHEVHHILGDLPGNVVQGVKVLDLTGDLHRQVFRVDLCDPVNAADTPADGLQVPVRTNAHRGDRAHTRNDDPAHDSVSSASVHWAVPIRRKRS